jgi:hypothetical protein
VRRRRGTAVREVADDLGFGDIVVSEIEAPNNIVSVNLV